MFIWGFWVNCHFKDELFRSWFQHDKTDGLSSEILKLFNILQYLNGSLQSPGRSFSENQGKTAPHLQLQAHQKAVKSIGGKGSDKAG